MEMSAEKLTIDELIKINLDALKNFKNGDRRLLIKRTSDDPMTNYELLNVRDVAKEIVLKIIKASCNSNTEGIGMLEEIKHQCLLP